MSSIIQRNKEIMKKFETMICHQDKTVQEKLWEELVDSIDPFYTPISPEPLYGGKRYLSLAYMLRKSFSDVQWKIFDMAVDEEKSCCKLGINSYSWWLIYGKETYWKKNKSLYDELLLY